MTAELLILLHYFKGKAAPLLRCLSCHFLFPHFVPARARGGSAPGWAGAPGRVPGAMAPLCPCATLGSSSLSSRCLLHPFGPPSPASGVSLGWDAQARCPCRLSPGCRGSLASVGGGVAACVLRAPAHCSGGGFWAAVSPPVTSTPRLQPQRSGQERGRGLGLARSPVPSIGTGRDVERSVPEICDIYLKYLTRKAPGHEGMLSPLLPLQEVPCPCSSFPSVTVPGWCLGAHPGCRDPAEPQMCPDPSPWPGSVSAPFPCPAHARGAEAEPGVPVLGRSLRRGRVSRAPGDTGATKPRLPRGTQPGWCHQGRVRGGAGGVTPPGNAEHRPSVRRRNGQRWGWGQGQGMGTKPGRGWT